MNQEKRLILFLVLATALLLIFSPRLAPPPEDQKPAAEQTGDAAPGSASGEGVALRDGSTTAVAIAATPRPGPTAPAPTPAVAAVPLPDPVIVKNDIFEVELSPIGGRPQRWRITDPHFVGKASETDEAETLDMIPYRPGLTTFSELPLEILLHDPAQNNFDDVNYTLMSVEQRDDEDGRHIVTFTSPAIRGFVFQKTYTFHPESFVADLTVSVTNTTDARYRFNDEGTGFTITWGPGLRTYFMEGGGTYFYRSQYVRPIYAGKDYVKMQDIKYGETWSVTDDIRWAGLNSKYFLAAMAPQDNERGIRVRSFVRSKNEFPKYREKPKEFFPPATVELTQAAFELNPGESRSFAYTIYSGPKERKILKEAGHGFQEALFSSSWRIIRPLQFPLLDALVWLNGIFNNYGIAIIVLTLLIKILLYPVNHKMIKSTAKFQAQSARLKPAMDALNQKYKNDPQARGRAMMDLYKKHGLNPLAPMQGCLPALLMAPVFIAFYWLLAESIELRNSSFLWIKDLSQPDHLLHLPFSIPLLGEWFNILPVLMGASQVVVSKLSMRNSPNIDPMQKQMMIMFPVVFTFLLYNLPSGLVLYWTVSNVFQIFHTLITNSIIKKEMEKHKGESVAELTT